MFNLLYGLGWIVSLLPLRVLYLFSDFFYLIIYYLAGYRKKVVRENLANSFPDKTLAERKRIERKFYHQFCDLFVESMHMMHMSNADMLKRMDYVGVESVCEQVRAGKSVMIMTAHNANWEWGISFPLFVPAEVPSYQIYKRLSNERFDKIMYAMRSKFGGVNVERRELPRFMVRMKNEQKPGVFWMISDQNPSSHIHYWSKFLNQNTPTLIGTEQLARKFDYPVFYAEIKRVKRGYYHWELIPISLEPLKTAEFEISEKYMQLLQKTIESQPESWLWTHRRWKHKM